MFQHIHIHMNERAVLVRDGKAVRALTPGRYTFFKRYEIYQWNIDQVVFHTLPVVLEALPPEWYETVRLAQGQYGIVYVDERPTKFLRPGVHRVWRLNGDVQLRVFAETDPLPQLTKELREVIPADELVETTIEINQRGVLVRDGTPERVLEPGYFAFWGKHNSVRWPARPVRAAYHHWYQVGGLVSLHPHALGRGQATRGCGARRTTQDEYAQLKRRLAARTTSW